MTLPRSHAVLLDAQDARIAARSVEEATRRHLACLTAIQARTIAAQLRQAHRAALLASIALERHATTLDQGTE